MYGKDAKKIPYMASSNKLSKCTKKKCKSNKGLHPYIYIECDSTKCKKDTDDIVKIFMKSIFKNAALKIKNELNKKLKKRKEGGGGKRFYPGYNCKDECKKNEERVEKYRNQFIKELKKCKKGDRICFEKVEKKVPIARSIEKLDKCVQKRCQPVKMDNAFKKALNTYIKCGPKKCKREYWMKKRMDKKVEECIRKECKRGKKEECIQKVRDQYAKERNEIIRKMRRCSKEKCKKEEKEYKKLRGR